MACPDGTHEMRAVLPFQATDADGNLVEVIGVPPQTETEPAWCRICGALWTKLPFSMGWGFVFPIADREAPTLANLIRSEGHDG